MKLKKNLTDRFEGIIEHIKGFILAFFVIITVLGVVVGYRYYRYTQDDPQYCASCHLMKEAFTEWQKGKHRDVVCQKCHHLSILEQNKLLVAYVAKGKQPLKQTHGREKPWNTCKGCHMDNVMQGSVTMKKSYGHARHVFMQSIDCKMCHKSALHNFHPNGSACQDCHKDKGVHGIGMEAFSCLNCHSFSEQTPSMIPKGACIKCHTKLPSKGPMAGLRCHECHKPHGKISPAASHCSVECHQNEASVGQHGFHMNKGLGCLDCHKPHLWVVGQERARVICTKCHAYKDPKVFIF